MQAKRERKSDLGMNEDDELTKMMNEDDEPTKMMNGDDEKKI